MQIPVAEADILGLQADNPGPFTLTGTNSWLVGRDPAWLIDPGPGLDSHIEALAEAIAARGGLAGIVLTHDHADHSDGVDEIRRRFPQAALAAARGEVDVPVRDGDRIGPFEAIATPGHAEDHLAFVAGDVGFSGDAVLGEGSVFVAPYPGALAGYLEGLKRLRARELRLLLPGHGPVIEDPNGKLEAYLAHRLERERKLIAALQAGARTVDELLDRAWDDAPAALRPAAGWTLAAHLDKLEAEGRLPEGVERPALTG